MPSKKENPEASGLDTSADLIAELAEKEAEQAAPAGVERKELTHGTVLDTNTKYEDRTRNPVEDRDVDYETEEVALDSGTVLTNVLGIKGE